MTVHSAYSMKYHRSHIVDIVDKEHCTRLMRKNMKLSECRICTPCAAYMTDDRHSICSIPLYDAATRQKHIPREARYNLFMHINVQYNTICMNIYLHMYGRVYTEAKCLCLWEVYCECFSGGLMKKEIKKIFDHFILKIFLIRRTHNVNKSTESEFRLIHLTAFRNFAYMELINVLIVRH